jgi:gliding motility-associated lipoprotein GldH
MKFKCCLIVVVFIFLSCDQNRIYSEFDSNLENNRWSSNDSKEFSFSIENEEVVDVILHLGHIYDFQFASIPIQMEITYPDGHTEIIPIDLKVKNEKGEDIADCSGDICDLYYKVKNKVTLEKGNYSIVITNKFNGAYLPNILGVGVQIKK